MYLPMATKDSMRCSATHSSVRASDGTVLRCEKPAGHRGRHEAQAGFIRFPWEGNAPKLFVVSGGKETR